MGRKRCSTQNSVNFNNEQKKKVDSRNLSFHDLENNQKELIVPKNEEQKEMIKIIMKNTITFVRGYPGSGKTLMSVMLGLQLLFKGKYEQLVFSRPAVEAAGEKLGYLPGDMNEKINPYMIPIFDALAQILPGEILEKLFNRINPRIKIIPLAFMRGVTLKNAFILMDEVQNTTPEQMRMLLTRIGENSKMVLCGDVNQSDIRSANGLQDAFDLLNDVPDIGFVTLSSKAVVRHPIIEKIEEKYLSRKLAQENNV